MKEKIMYVLCTIFDYVIAEDWEDDRYYYVCIKDSVLTYVVLRELIEQGLCFVIDTYDTKGIYITIAFEKEWLP